MNTRFLLLILLTLGSFGCSSLNLSGKLADAIVGCRFFSVQDKGISKREFLSGNLEKPTRSAEIELDLSRGKGCPCDTLQCEFRAIPLSAPFVLGTNDDYTRFVELVQGGYETDPVKISELKLEMQRMQKNAVDHALKTTCFVFQINLEDATLKNEASWEIVLVGTSLDAKGVELPLTFNAPTFGTQQFQKFKHVACSSSAIDLEKAFSLRIRSLDKNNSKHFQLEWSAQK